MKKIAIGCDHAGYQLKEKLKKYLQENGWEVKDYGTYSEDSVDYPDFAHPLAEAVSNKEFEKGILICGSANGVAMAANKHQDVRAAITWTDEISRLAREHNNANIICLPSRFVSEQDAIQMTKTFLETAFEGGRHERRVNKIRCA